MMHDPWMDRLSEYLDKELEPKDREALAAHLEDCAACASTLADLRAVRARARELPDAPAPADLWSRIEASIRAGRKGSFALIEKHAPRARGGRFSFTLPELIAACLVAAILSGGGVFALARHKASPRSQTPVTSIPSAPTPTSETPGQTKEPERIASHEPVSPGPMAVPAARTVDAVTAERTTETPHEAAIAELRKALAKERDRLDPATIRTLESNLAIIDLAIDQAKRALAADPANTYVREHLAETMRRKVELLQRATLLASASNAEGPK